MAQLIPLQGIPQADPDATLWRYMDFGRFLDLVLMRRLYFARLDQMEDQWEGRLPAAALRELDRVVADAERDGIAAPPGGWEKSRAFVKTAARQMSFVNCWHHGEHESFALWRMYTGGRGVAISSSAMMMTDALLTEHKVHYGLITYAHHETAPSFGGSLYPAFLKHPGFAYENEFRLAMMSPSVDNVVRPDLFGIGIHVEVDLHKLITGVHLSPFAGGWMTESVQRLLKSHGVDVEVVQSDLGRTDFD